MVAPVRIGRVERVRGWWRSCSMTTAERLVRTLYRLTEGQPGYWRMIGSIGAAATPGAIDRACKAGWIEVEGGHSVRLTEVGRRKVEG